MTEPHKPFDGESMDDFLARTEGVRHGPEGLRVSRSLRRMAYATGRSVEDIAAIVVEGVTQEHQGWKNFPTWTVNHWLANDAGLKARTLETLKGAAEFYEVAEAEEPWRVFVADWLKDFVTEELLADGLAPQSSSDSPASLIDDLAQWAMSHVDWLELTDAWLRNDRPNYTIATADGVVIAEVEHHDISDS